MAKKSFMSDDDAPQISKPTLAQVDAAIYGDGAVAIPDSGRQVNKPVSLDVITPDPTQPRREVPVTVRKKAREQKMAEWLVWYQMAERLAGKEIPLTALLRGEGEAPESAVGEDDPVAEGKPREIKRTGKPLVDDFMELVSLAASIHRDGLANAITVTSRGMDRYQIETGERRYQAFKLLYGALQDEKFARIPARVVDKIDIWRQAAENGSRKPLNAIGMARQLALLIMELNKGRDGISYLPFDKFESECDRAFYAQVADGNIHRIPKGSSERILQATGLKSQRQIAYYRALLNIPDDVWMTADEEGWAEFRIREHVRPPSQKADTRTDSSGMNVREGHLVGANAPIVYPLEGPGRKWATYHGQRVQLECSVGMPPKGMRVWLLDERMRRTRAIDTTWNELSHISDSIIPPTPRLNDAPSLASSPTLPPASYDVIGQSSAGRLAVGQTRRSAGGKLFKVVSITPREVSIVEVNAAGKTISSPFGKPVSVVMAMPLEVTAEDLQRETAEMLREAEMLIPDWITVGKIVIRDHDIPKYRYKGPVTSVEWDKGIKDYAVSLRWAGDGKIHGPYPASALRADDGSEPRAESVYAPETEVYAPEAAQDQDEVADGDDIFKNIFQHFKTGALYHITSQLDDSTVLVVKLDQNGVETDSAPERFRMDDLVLYQRVYANLPQTGTISAGVVSDPDDDFDGDDDETEDESAVSAEDALAQIERGHTTERRPAPEMGAWMKYYEYGQKRVYGSVVFVEWDANANDYHVRLQTETGVKPFWAKALTLAGDETDPGILTEDAMPEGGWKRGMQVITRGGHKGTIAADAGGITSKAWVLIEGIAHPQPHWSGTLRLAEGDEVDIGHALESEEDLMTAEPSRTIDDSGDLPEWARYGATVVYRATGEICDVLGAVWAPDPGLWLLRVTRRGDGDMADVPLVDFDLVNAPAAQPHPALHPKNMNGVICEEQHLIGAIGDIARRRGLNTTLITSMNTTTAIGLEARLRKSGFEATRDHLDAGLAATLHSIHDQEVIAKRVHAEMMEVLYQLSKKLAS